MGGGGVDKLTLIPTQLLTTLLLKLKPSLAIKRDIVSTTSLPVDWVTDCNAAARDRKSMVVW